MSSLFFSRQVYLANIHKIHPIKKQLSQALRAAECSQLGSLGSKNARSAVLPKATKRVDLTPFKPAIAAKPEQAVGKAVEIKADEVTPAKPCALPEPYRRVDENSSRHAPVDLPALRLKLTKDRMQKRVCFEKLACRAKSREHYRDLAVYRRQK